MRLLVDASGVTRDKAGVGVYAINLVAALASQPGIRLFLVAQSDDEDFDYSRYPGVTMIWVPSRLWRRPPVRILFEQTLLPWLLRKHRIQVVHSLHYSFPLITFGAKSVVTIHDMTSYLMPEVHIPMKLRYYRFYIRAAVTRADALIFVSRSAQSDFHERFGSPRGISRVVHHGKSEKFRCRYPDESLQSVRTQYELPEQFVLYIGTIEPRKNLVRLVQAFSQIADSHPDVALVIAGMKGWMYADLFECVKQLGLGTRVFFPGFVAEEDKPLLLSAAKAFAYVSLYEGFGLPVLEALACGIPAVASDVSSVPEIAGDAALLVDPYSVQQIAEAMHRLLSEPALRRTLQHDGLKQAAKFTWTQTALLTLKTYHEALEGNHTQAAQESPA